MLYHGGYNNVKYSGYRLRRIGGGPFGGEGLGGPFAIELTATAHLAKTHINIKARRMPKFSKFLTSDRQTPCLQAGRHKGMRRH